MLIEIEGHVLFTIKDEIGDEFHYILECKHFEKKIGILALMLIVETDLVLLNLEN